VNVPRSGVNPERVLEMALDIEQPDASRDGNSYDGHLDNKERLQVNKRDHCLDHGRNNEIRRHRAEPPLPTNRIMPTGSLSWTFKSLLATNNSHSAGRQMSAHFSWRSLNITSIVGPLGNNALQAVGSAIALKDHPSAPISVCAGAFLFAWPRSSRIGED
jgi:hypothetical protein